MDKKNSGFFILLYNNNQFGGAATSCDQSTVKNMKNANFLLENQILNSGELVHADLIITGVRDDPSNWDSLLLRQK